MVQSTQTNPASSRIQHARRTKRGRASVPSANAQRCRLKAVHVCVKKGNVPGTKFRGGKLSAVSAARQRHRARAAKQQVPSATLLWHLPLHLPRSRGYEPGPTAVTKYPAIGGARGICFVFLTHVIRGRGLREAKRDADALSKRRHHTAWVAIILRQQHERVQVFRSASRLHTGRRGSSTLPDSGSHFTRQTQTTSWYLSTFGTHSIASTVLTSPPTTKDEGCPQQRSTHGRRALLLVLATLPLSASSSATWSQGLLPLGSTLPWTKRRLFLPAPTRSPSRLRTSLVHFGKLQDLWSLTEPALYFVNVLGAKILYSCRTVTPLRQAAALRHADSHLRLAQGRLRHGLSHRQSRNCGREGGRIRIWPSFDVYDLDSVLCGQTRTLWHLRRGLGPSPQCREGCRLRGWS